MKATREIELKKGVILTLWVELHELDEAGDVWEGTSATHDKWISTEFEVKMGEKTLVGNSICTSDAQMKMYREKGVIPQNTEILLTAKDGKQIARIGLTHENAEKFREAVESAKKEVTTPEAKAFFAEKELKERNDKIAQAQDIINRAEKYVAEVGRLRTNADRREWERNYNNAMNEGGDGFVPHYPSQEEYNEAKEILASLQ